MQGAEGFSKRKLFEILDGLEAESRPLMEAARKRVAAEKGGEDALKPWNLSHALAGDVEKVILLNTNTRILTSRFEGRFY